MSKPFKRIGILSKQRGSIPIADTIQSLITYLKKKHVDIAVDLETTEILSGPRLPTYPREKLGQYCDLFIVVGGDGSMLSAARAALLHNTPVIGINRGRLGFLTDIAREEMHKKLDLVLEGEYLEEARFLLSAQIANQNKIISRDLALNDVVLLPGDVAHMIEFEVWIDDQPVLKQRADGMITTTPTGSTAYALSGGGPILHPHLDAIALVPMFPHTLSSRPVVVKGSSHIKILVSEENETSPRLSCDGQERVPVTPGHHILIQKEAKKLRLIHPKEYNYFETLRSKLAWNLQN